MVVVTAAVVVSLVTFPVGMGVTVLVFKIKSVTRSVISPVWGCKLGSVVLAEGIAKISASGISSPICKVGGQSELGRFLFSRIFGDVLRKESAEEFAGRTVDR